MPKRLSEVIGNDNIGTTYFTQLIGSILEDRTNDAILNSNGQTTYGSFINFEYLGILYSVSNLIGYGFDSKCGSCRDHYSIVFESGDDISYTTSSDLNGNHYLLHIGIETNDIIDGKSLCKRIMFALRQENIILNHYQQYGYEDAKLWIFDYRIFETSSRKGRLYDYPYKAIKSIEASYSGPSIVINNDYDPSNVTVTLTYKDETTEVIDGSEYDISTLTVVQKPYQQCAVMCKDSIYKAGFQVPVLYPTQLTVQYGSEYAVIGQIITPEDIIVTLEYNEQDKNTILTKNQYSIVNPIINSYGHFTVFIKELLFNEFISEIQVFGIRFVLDMDVKYIGPDIGVLDEINPENVVVTLTELDATKTKTITEVIKYSNEYITIEGKECTNDFNLDTLLVSKEGDNIFNVIYKDPLIDITKEFNVTGVAKLIEIKGQFIGEDKLIGDTLQKEEFEITGLYKISKFETEERPINNWQFVTMPIISDSNNGTFTIRYSNQTCEVSVPYSVFTGIRLNVWYEGAKIEVGKFFDPNNLVIYLINDSTEEKMSLNYKKVSIETLGIKKEGWNFILITYMNQYQQIKQYVAIEGYIPKKTIDKDFQVLYLDKETNEEIDYTDTFYDIICVEDVFILSWNAFLNAVNSVQKYGMYIVTVPKNVGLSNKYAMEWKVLSINRLTLKATINKIYDNQEED